MALAPQTFGSADADGSPSSPHRDSEALLLNVKDPEEDQADTNVDSVGSKGEHCGLAELPPLCENAQVASKDCATWMKDLKTWMAGDWQKSKMTCKLIGMHFFLVLPHIISIATVGDVKAEYLLPCNSEAGCVFQRLWDSQNVASTGGYFASVKNGEANVVTLSQNTHGHQQANFTFTSDNHSSRVAEMRAKVSRPLIEQLILWIGRLPSELLQGPPPEQWPALCESMTPEEMQERCNSESMKMGFQNHLLGAGMYTSMVLTCLWGVASALHDYLVLANFQPQLTLSIGFFSLLLHTVAAIAGVYWASGCAQVFASPHPVGNCSCFYEMPVFEAVAAMISPIWLLKGATDQFSLWVDTVLYGDCLYFPGTQDTTSC